MSDGTGNPVFSDCYDVSGTGSHSGDINKTFTAPLTPGVYYITQVSSWEYSCYGRGAGNPGNNPANAFAVVVVDFSENKITASTTATVNSQAGVYPITLLACSNYNPNYEISLQNGTLTIVTTINKNRSDNRSLEVSKLLENDVMDVVFPNPASTLIRLNMKEAMEFPYCLLIYDPLGNVVHVPTKKLGAGLYEMNVTMLPIGVYMIKAVYGNKVKTYKFVKR
jgi:hypothetical protein